MSPFSLGILGSAHASAGGPLTIDYLTHGHSTADSNTYTFSNLSFGSTGAGREIIVGVAWGGAEMNPGNAASLSSASIGGVSATIDASSSGVYAAIFRAAPSGTTGDVMVNLSAVVTNCFVALWRASRAPSPGASDVIYAYPLGSTFNRSVIVAYDRNATLTTGDVRQETEMLGSRFMFYVAGRGSQTVNGFGFQRSLAAIDYT